MTYDFFWGYGDYEYSEESYNLVVSVLPGVWYDMLVRGLFAFGPIALYFLAVYGHNPKKTYQQLSHFVRQRKH